MLLREVHSRTKRNAEEREVLLLLLVLLLQNFLFCVERERVCVVSLGVKRVLLSSRVCY